MLIKMYVLFYCLMWVNVFIMMKDKRVNCKDVFEIMIEINV